MKRLFLILFSALFLVPAMAEAYDFEVDGIYYDVISPSARTVRVTFKAEYEPSYAGDIVIPDSVTHDGRVYAVKSIGNYAFFCCTGVTSVSVPATVAMIEDYAAFTGCENIEQIVFCEGLKTIGKQSFSGCKMVKEIVIPNTVRRIDYYAFQYCESLERVTLGQNVEKLGALDNSQGVFASCKRISEVRALMQQPSGINFGTFDYGVYSTATLRVPVGTKALYAASEGWKLFTNIVEDAECGAVGQ